MAPKAALLVRLALWVKAADELPWLAWLELELLADPVPVVLVVAWLFPVVLALFEPVLDGLLNAVLLLVCDVSFAFPDEEEAEFAAAELEEPLWLALALRTSEAARLSVALTAPLDERADEDCSCAPMEALWLKLLVVEVEAPKLELSCAPWAKLSDEDSLALWLRVPVFMKDDVSVVAWLKLELEFTLDVSVVLFVLL